MNKLKYSRLPVRDFNALAPPGGGQIDDMPVNYVNKRKQRSGEEVVFNPQAHKEFLTGFRKRKLQRKKEAMDQIQKKAREDRLVHRAEKRAKLKEQLGLDDNYGVQDSDDEEGKTQGGAEQHERPTAVKVYETQPGLTTTVNIIALDSDGEQAAEEGTEEGEEGSDGDDGTPAWLRQQQQATHSGRGDSRGSNKAAASGQPKGLPGLGSNASHGKGGTKKPGKLQRKLQKEQQRAKRAALSKAGKDHHQGDDSGGQSHGGHSKGHKFKGKKGAHAVSDGGVSKHPKKKGKKGSGRH